MGGKKKKKLRIDDWIERDLSAAARAADLPPAFEVDDAVRRVEEILLAGADQSPVLVGRAGVGKSAVFLLSDMASGVSGQILYVDCGYSAMGL